ncbi:MAG: DUF4180 domain-containing protein [Bacillota bacterium]
MSINHTILGILSCQPLSGYDLKKIIQDSPFMYWSGNNNQIYRALTELLDEGYVTHEIQHQESSPSKKIYTITAAGLDELDDWVRSTPELPELKNDFLIRLAWADQLKPDELISLLSRYENELRQQVLLLQEKERRGTFTPDRTPREAYLWDMIHDNTISTYVNELEWLQRLRQGLGIGHEKEANRMKLNIVEQGNQKYLECLSAEPPLSTNNDALDLVAACGEHETELLMLHAKALSDDFFRLKTGIAGVFLQKFVNYHLRVALIIPDERKIQGKFRDLLAESARGNSFRAFACVAEAEPWLI